MREVAEKWLHGGRHRERVHPLPWIKAWAGLLGMSGGAVRPPLRSPGADEVAALGRDLARAGLL
ncbi:MAG: hypothetical protein M0Z40_11545 [Actinomycetota bacterium]|nr:hypothetical protein [Actinomycetota bacterium]